MPSESSAAYTPSEEDLNLVREFLLPSADEVQGILAPGWVRPKSLRAKEIIVRLLDWDDDPSCCCPSVPCPVHHAHLEDE